MPTEDVLRSLESPAAVASPIPLGVPPFASAALDVFKAGPRGPILQLPVDDGSTTSFLADQVSFVVGLGTGVDAVHQAQTTITQRGLGNCLLATGDLNSLPFPDSQFAGVFSAEFLGHLRHPCCALREMLRVCRPGGHVVVDFIAPRDSTRHTRGMSADTDGGYLSLDKTFYRYLDKLGLEEILAAAAINDRRIDRMSWQEDSDSEPTDILHRRESWVVVARKGWS